MTPAHRRWPIVGDDERRAVQRVLDRGVLSGPNAPEATAFEREFAAFVSAKHALLTHSGTSALYLALVAAGVGAGDHVLCPAYTFVATPLAILQAGAIPIFVDVDEETGALEAAAAAGALTPRTRAVMPVHVHGCAVDMGALLAFAGEHRLAVIEDAAQAHGAMWGGRPVGPLGRAGAFSLQSSKNLGAGEGGVLVTNDDDIAVRANAARNFGQPIGLPDAAAFDAERPLDTASAPDTVTLGAMYRGGELTAALARAMLAQLPERTARCQDNAERLSRALAELPGVLPPLVRRGSTSVHHKVRIRLDAERAGVAADARALRDATMAALRSEGLEVVLWQTKPLPAHPLFQSPALRATYPWSTDPETPFEAMYSPSRFPRTTRLLDGSFLLFSQSCPLIAQSRETVDRYVDTFRTVWHRRHELVARRSAQ